MKLEHLSLLAQNGLRRWALDIHKDEMLFDGIASCSEAWAWIFFELRESADNPDWFPRGKWATIQVIEDHLISLAKEAIKQEPTHAAL